MEADVNALLESAAAAAMPRVEEPKKEWPLPFETGGGTYVFASEYGLYYDSDSCFYYDTQSKLYYSSFTGAYYRCLDGSKGANATFEAFTPPAPVDDAKYSGSTVSVKKATTAGGGATFGGGFSLNISKKEKKKPLSFGMKTAVAGSNKAKESFVGSTVAGSAAASGTSMKRKSAVDIAKWSQLQRDSKATEGVAAETPAGNAIDQKQTLKASSAPTTQQPTSTSSSAAVDKTAEAKATSDVNNLVDVAAEAPICLVSCSIWCVWRSGWWLC